MYCKIRPIWKDVRTGSRRGTGDIQKIVSQNTKVLCILPQTPNSIFVMLKWRSFTQFNFSIFEHKTCTSWQLFCCLPECLYEVGRGGGVEGRRWHWSAVLKYKFYARSTCALSSFGRRILELKPLTLCRFSGWTFAVLSKRKMPPNSYTPWSTGGDIHAEDSVFQLPQVSSVSSIIR